MCVRREGEGKGEVRGRGLCYPSPERDEWPLMSWEREGEREGEGRGVKGEWWEEGNLRDECKEVRRWEEVIGEDKGGTAENY